MLRHSSIPTQPLALLLTAVILLTVVATPVTAAAVEITDFNAPSSAEPGETVTVDATAEANLAMTAEMELRLIREDTGEVLCQTTFWNPGSDRCSGSFQMPEDDVTVEAEVKFADAQTFDTQSATITVDGHSGGNNADDDDDDGGLFDFSLDDFTDGMYEAFYNVLDTFMLGLFEDVMTVLLNAVPRLLTYTPDVAGNPAVEDMHDKTLIVAYATGTLAVAVIGLLYMTGPIIGISYQQVRPLLPRLLVAIIFATISLPLLQLAVDGTNALTTAFTPDSFNFQQMSGMGAGLLLVIAINTALLVALAALFIIRDIYILFVAAISPLLAVLWVFPKARRYADSFIAGWFAALLMAPLDMLVFHFLIEMMEGTGGGPEAIANWLFGIAGFILLLFIPYQLYSASQAGVGASMLIAHQIVQKRDYMKDVDRAAKWLDEQRMDTSRANQQASAAQSRPDRVTERQYDPNSGRVVTPETNKFHTKDLEETFNQQETAQETSPSAGEEPADVDRQEQLSHYEKPGTETDNEPSNGSDESDTVTGDET
jgi:hypothetical protein